MGSFAYRSKQLKLKWKEGVPFEFNGKMTFAEFRLDSIEIKQECENQYVTGDFSCLEGNCMRNPTRDF